MSMITKKLRYNEQQDMIIYKCIDVTTMHIINELKWRTVFLKMHIERFIWFFFTIKKRTWRANCMFINV